MSFGKSNDIPLQESYDLINYQGRKFRRSSTTSAIANRKGSDDILQTTSIMPRNSPGQLGGSTRPSTNQLSPSVGTLTRSIILPPPQPSPQKTSKGRPFSAKRTIMTRPRSIPTLQPLDEYRLQFALQHSKPLPPIGNPDHTHQPHPHIAASPTPDMKLLTEVDSAVDLDYYSQCGTPVDLQYITMLDPSGGNSPQCSKHELDYSPKLELKSRLPCHSGQATVMVCLKLPNGERLQTDLPVATTLEQVVSHAETASGMNLRNCEISTNEIPKRVFSDRSLTLYNAGIIYRTVLHFSLP